MPFRSLIWLLIVLLAPPLAWGASATDPLPNDFPSAGLTVPRSDIIAGGPPRDAIHSVDDPKFVTAQEAIGWVRDEHSVVGVVLGDVARAYPVHLLEYHQLVNDRLGDRDVVIAYDPLVDVARAYLAGAAGKPAKFGVSGLIYRCNFLLFDRASLSLWTQFEGRAISGKQAGAQLESLPVRVETLAKWRERQPGTLVMSPPEPRRFDYRYSNFSAYWVSSKIPFPVEHVDPRVHPKELVLGARVGDQTRAYLAAAVERSGGRVVDEFAGHRIRVEYDPVSGTFSYEAPDAVRMTSAYWFAWKNFFPKTELWNLELDTVPATSP